MPRGRGRKRKHGEYGDSPDEMMRWAEDFYSGYLYDPDGKLVSEDLNKSPRKFLNAVDKAIEWMPAMTDQEREKLVSRLLQWKKRICEEADIRFLKIEDFIENGGDAPEKFL